MQLNSFQQTLKFLIAHSYWELNENQVHALLKFLDRQSGKHFIDHVWSDPGRNRIYYTDYDIIMINHSIQPTLSYEMMNEIEQCYTARALYPGDEFTEDYQKCSIPQYLHKLGIEYGISEEFL